MLHPSTKFKESRPVSFCIILLSLIRLPNRVFYYHTLLFKWLVKNMYLSFHRLNTTFVGVFGSSLKWLAHYSPLWWHIKQAITPADNYGWLLNIGWLSRRELAEEAPVAHYGHQRWQVRAASGQSIATSSARSIEPLAQASSICNFKAPGSVLERCEQVYVFVLRVCLWVHAAHYSFVSPEWATAIQSLCAPSGRGDERPI